MAKQMTILERLENRFYTGDDPIPDAIRYIEDLEERVIYLEDLLFDNGISYEAFEQ